MVEGHIETAHAFSGAQHLRLSRDLAIPGSSIVDARFPRNEDVLPQPIAPTTVSFDIAVDCCTDWRVILQSREQNLLTTMIWFYTEFNQPGPGGANLILVLDDRTGMPEWHVEHHRDADGNYQRLVVSVDPCNDRITMSYAGNPFYSGRVWSGTNVDQFVVFGDNQLFANLDVDNLVIETGIPCPVFGACCDTNGAGQGCVENILDGECDGVGLSFTANASCDEIECGCIPDCVNRTCGPDGCGGSCGSCGNGNLCDGIETCSSAGQCQPGTPLACDDGLYCNGAETCHPQQGCRPGSIPCTENEICDEPLSSCSPAPIPAVQEWGLVVMALVLLVCAKLHFRRLPIAS